MTTSLTGCDVTGSKDSGESEIVRVRYEIELLDLDQEGASPIFGATYAGADGGQLAASLFSGRIIDIESTPRVLADSGFYFAVRLRERDPSLIRDTLKAPPGVRLRLLVNDEPVQDAIVRQAPAGFQRRASVRTRAQQASVQVVYTDFSSNSSGYFEIEDEAGVNVRVAITTGQALIEYPDRTFNGSDFRLRLHVLATDRDEPPLLRAFCPSFYVAYIAPDAPIGRLIPRTLFYEECTSERGAFPDSMVIDQIIDLPLFSSAQFESNSEG